MEWMLAILALVVIILFNQRDQKSKTTPEAITESTESTDTISATGNYQSKWLFSTNEKDAYQKIKTITDKHGLHLFAKVRLYDLIEPKKGIPKYKTYLFKIQSKHVDFVICDNKLVATCVIELDDNSHANKKRQERDNFVDDALKTAGYKIIHIFAVKEEELESAILNSIKTPTAT